MLIYCIVYGGSVMDFVLVCTTKCLFFLFCNHLDEEERCCCFTFIVFCLDVLLL